jgi:RecB family exonuclease
VSDRAPSLDELLERISAGRRAAPLAPVTVICPSHLAALQLRRRLAEAGPFAGVRFETLPRLAELIGAGSLAASGRRPLARPIGDHLAERVAAQSLPPLAAIRDLPGYARLLRRLFARLRRAGLRGGEESPPTLESPHLREVMRLYGLWRREIAAFYDDDDLLGAAAVVVRAEPERAQELGELFLVPPAPRSADGIALLDALRAARGTVIEAAEPAPGADVRLVLAPDLASEAREAAREVLTALEEGVALHEVAVLHGADRAYARPLREALAAAGVPVSAMPGLPLVETPAGRGVLLLLELALHDLSRTALVDALGVAPLRRDLPTADRGRAPLRLGRWDRLSRAAGVTHGIERWREGIRALRDDREAQVEAAARDGVDRAWMREEAADAETLLAVVEALWERLRDLAPERRAADFLRRLLAVVSDYLDPAAAGTEEVLAEVERLGTVDAVGGTFGLASFARALRVNLEAASMREGRFGEGVLVADHRAAVGLRFARIVLCGAVEGLLPAGPGADAIVPDAAWAALRRTYPLIEDAARRIELARDAADRALGCGAVVTMTCPLHEGAGTRDHYPSPLAVVAARRHGRDVRTATALRAHPPAGWLRRPASPLAAQLRGPAIDAWEVGLRGAAEAVLTGAAPAAGDPLARRLRMIRARAGAELSEWDGNLAELVGDGWLRVPDPVSPTRLEQYGACGFRFLLGSLLGLRVPEEPSNAETIDPLVRGNIVHAALERFFRERRDEGRPAPGEPWGPADEDRLLALLDDELRTARRRGLTGVAVLARQQERAMRADMREFLRQDTAFRRETGAVPHEFERRIDVTAPGGQRFTGYVDRIDRDPGGRVWVVDYKTGRVPDPGEGPFAGGRRLQLPVYLLAAGGSEATALYWYVTARGGFERVPYTATAVNDRGFAAVLAAIADGVAAGSFPAVPGEFNDFFSEFENCGRCDFTRICARGRGDDFDRKASDAAVAPWAGVAAAAASVPGSP